jgi:hypothetical protein
MTKTIDQLEDEAQRNESRQASDGRVCVFHDGFQFDYYDTKPFAKPQIDREEAIALLAAEAYDRQGMPAATPRVPSSVIVGWSKRALIKEYCLPTHMLAREKNVSATEVSEKSKEWRSRWDKSLTMAVTQLVTERGMRQFHARYLIQPSWMAAKIAVQWWHDEDGDETGRGWQGDFIDTIGM